MECCFHAGFNSASKLHKKGKNKLRRLFLHPPRTPNRRKSVFWDPPWVPQGVDVVYGCSLTRVNYFYICLSFDPVTYLFSAFNFDIGFIRPKGMAYFYFNLPV